MECQYKGLCSCSNSARDRSGSRGGVPKYCEDHSTFEKRVQSFKAEYYQHRGWSVIPGQRVYREKVKATLKNKDCSSVETLRGHFDDIVRDIVNDRISVKTGVSELDKLSFIIK